MGERFTSRASAGESCKIYYHLGRSVSLLDAHVLKEDRPSHWEKSPYQSLATERPVMSGLGVDGKDNYGDGLTMAAKMVMERWPKLKNPLGG